MARRHEEGQCFKCPEKWSWAHQKTCLMRDIYLLDINEDEQPDDDSLDSEADISLHTLSGACTAETMRLPVSMQDQSLITLIDSGSTHCFMVAHVTHRLNLTPTAKDGITVGVANGERLPCLGVCSALPLAINGELYYIDFLVIALEGYEMVLGCNWLRTLGPIVWDFSRLSMAFWWLDHWVMWTGLAANRLLAFAISTNNHLQLLLAEFADVFAKPSGLAPPQPFDHRIHLLPSTPPVAVWPYRYPQPLKDEIEKQCDDMLRQGIIRPNMSPFSTLVLLVRKKDHT
jgi:hypothetical protein